MTSLTQFLFSNIKEVIHSLDLFISISMIILIITILHIYMTKIKNVEIPPTYVEGSDLSEGFKWRSKSEQIKRAI